MSFSFSRMASWRSRLLLLLALLAAIVLFDFLLATMLVRRYPDKLWLHRCNSIEKLREKSSKFRHYEVDLRFTPDGRFDVCHNPDESIGLYLDRYFQVLQPSSAHLWLDIKNLTPDNCFRMLHALDSLTHHYHIDRRRLIVESSNWRSLILFTQRGYYTSFYLPFPLPSRLTDAQIDSCIRLTRRVADSHCVRALSFSGGWYHTLKKRLHRPIDLLTWEHRTRRLWLLMLPRGREMVRDEQLKVILVKDKGHYHR